MASISKKNGKFHVRVRRKVYPTKCRSFTYKSDARSWAVKIERELDSGLLCDYSTTIYQLLERYLNEITIRKRSVNQETYRVRAIQRDKLSHFRISEIKSANITEFRDDRLSAVSGSTVIKDINLLSHVFKVAQQDWGYDGLNNPVAKIRKPKPNRPRDRRLIDGEFERLIGSARASEEVLLHFLIEFAIETGMRRGELLSTLWSDVHIEESYIHLPMTKNGSSRDVPLSSRAKSILSDLPRGLSEAVFPIHFEALKGLWKRACKRAGIEDLHFHDLRHEATTRFFEKGLNVMEVATITGHKDLRMLQRYTHLNASDLAAKLK